MRGRAPAPSQGRGRASPRAGRARFRRHEALAPLGEAAQPRPGRRGRGHARHGAPAGDAGVHRDEVGLGDTARRLARHDRQAAEDRRRADLPRPRPLRDLRQGRRGLLPPLHPPRRLPQADALSRGQLQFDEHARALREVCGVGQVPGVAGGRVSHVRVSRRAHGRGRVARRQEPAGDSDKSPEDALAETRRGLHALRHDRRRVELLGARRARHPPRLLARDGGTRGRRLRAAGPAGGVRLRERG